jgi:uncharacterized protein (UPF0332 family)/predicted nucleotidyltransferase
MATLTETTLDPDERRALERLVDLLREEYGSDLHAVWLYGSRARGEQTGPESDIDVMVITARGRGEWEAMSRLLRRAAADVEAEPWTFSIHPYGPEDLVRARAIESFFVREVDRDKIVLFGDESAPILTQGGENLRSGLFEGKMKSRSEEFMRVARRRLRAALVVADTGDFDSAVEPAYYASLNAARAALSEEDLYARTHRGVWHLFHETFVATGGFDPDLYASAHSAQTPRERSAYEAVVVEDERAKEIVEGAERFVAAVEATFE